MQWPQLSAAVIPTAKTLFFDAPSLQVLRLDLLEMFRDIILVDIPIVWKKTEQCHQKAP